MNPKIKAVQTALEKVDQIAARRRDLENEQKGLQPKIQKLTDRVADGDVKAINDLAIASARSAYGVPTELKGVVTEFDTAIHELRQTLIPLQSIVAKAFSKERARVEGIVAEFLGKLITDPADTHLVEHLRNQIVENSHTVKPLDHLNMRFSASNINQQRLAADSAISRARDAVASLSNIE